MIGYTCKYVPIEIFESLGIEMKKISPDVTNYDRADSIMYPTICSYAKGVLEDVTINDYEGVILTNCCDSTRRLYDALRVEFPRKFIYILDLPRKTSEDAVEVFESAIKRMINEYEKFTGKKLNKDKLTEVLNSKKKSPEVKKKEFNIGIMGARCNDGILNLVKECKGNIIFNMSCTGYEHSFDIKNSDNLLNEYADSLLHQLPCLRMDNVEDRDKFIEDNREGLDGIIYHTVKFCDIYSYEYASIKNNINIPILKVETDYTRQCEGQIKTRVEAFIESIKVKKEDAALECKEIATDYEETKIPVCSGCDINAESVSKYKARQEGLKEDVKREAIENKDYDKLSDNERGQEEMNRKDRYVLGIDSGSTSTNAVILNDRKEIVASHVVRTGAKSAESARRALSEVLSKSGLQREDLALIVSTGYGRVSIDFADKNVTEISCHGRGAHYLKPEVRTIIDIGGQDSKAIRLNDKGEVIDFVMNDKCAAGTGRFLEMMAKTLEIDIKDMGPEALKWKEDMKISSMCSVFAESEVISLIAQNKEKADIIHALCNSIAGKSNGLLGRVGRESKFMMTGGVAKNIGVVKAIEEKIGDSLFISDEPEIVGAIGAALFGLDEIVK